MKAKNRYYKILIIIILFIFLSVSVLATGYNLVFGDNFNNALIDTDKWTYNTMSVPATSWNITETDRLKTGSNCTKNSSNSYYNYLSSTFNLNENESGYILVKYQRIGGEPNNAQIHFCFGSEVEIFPNSWCGVCFTEGGDFFFNYPTGTGTLRLTPTMSTGGDNSVHEVKIVATRISNFTNATIATYYQNYFDGVLINAHNQTGATCKKARINATISARDTLCDDNVYNGAFANFSMYKQGAVDNRVRNTGDFCGKDSSVCISGWCEYQFCGLKPSKIACDFDSECASGDCSFGYCTKADTIEGLTNSKNLFMGSSENTGNLVSLAIMIALSVGVSSISILLAPFVFVATGIFFSIIGWLSVFIMVGILLIAIIMGVLAIVLNGAG